MLPNLLLTTFLPILALGQVLLPSQDPFYTSPTNVSSYQPGDVISSRAVSSNIQSLLGSKITINIAAFHQILYRTTDSLGDPVAAVTSVLVPKNADPSKLLAYENAYDSANINCSPSYSLRVGANTTAAQDTIFIVAALQQGWFVTTSDYEGLKAQYTAGVQSGYATLDSVRATLNFAPKISLSQQARYVLWGYSGGALASEWAAELQPQYAPELNFAGAALGGLTPNNSHTLSVINKGPAAGLAFAAVKGLTAAYADFASLVDKHLISEKKAQFNTIASGCISQVTQAGAFQDFFSYFDIGQKLLGDPVSVSTIAAAGQMGLHGVPSMPLFIYKALGDEISPAADTIQLYKKYCAQGATIQMNLDIIGEHISEAVTGSASAFAWVAERLAGQPVEHPGSCSTRYVALTELDIPTLLGFGGVLAALLQSLLGGSA